jgi:pyridinium-3,5-bisthiocarboxylic acid mononucleotide nickel chelatase
MLYLDMTKGVSGDMLVAACCSFMDEGMRLEFLRRVDAACREFDCSVALTTVEGGPTAGMMLEWDCETRGGIRSASEAEGFLERAAERLTLSSVASRFTVRVIRDIIEAEAKAHGIESEKVHLHEIGRMGGLMNIASAGLCWDMLGMGAKKVIGSYISVGGGAVETEHGCLNIPAPASSELLSGLRFRFGPSAGERATPTGIAIVRNLLSEQQDVLPKASRKGAGFGSRSFDGEKGSVMLFESGVSGAEG